ncbi:MAG: hypothetical protein ACQEVA_09560, partial [Myxococcota bacterium]
MKINYWAVSTVFVLLTSTLFHTACDPAGACEADDDCFSGEFCYQGTCTPTSEGNDTGDPDTSDATTDADEDAENRDTTREDTRHDDTDASDAAGPPLAVIELTAGALHTCALLESSEIMCWGDNGNGSLGTGNDTAGIETS